MKFDDMSSPRPGTTVDCDNHLCASLRSIRDNKAQQGNESKKRTRQLGIKISQPSNGTIASSPTNVSLPDH